MPHTLSHSARMVSASLTDNVRGISLQAWKCRDSSSNQARTITSEESHLARTANLLLRALAGKTPSCGIRPPVSDLRLSDRKEQGVMPHWKTFLATISGCQFRLATTEIIWPLRAGTSKLESGTSKNRWR